MPANRNALLRYRTIDRCLQNTGRRWTLDDLIEAVSDALYEYEGRQVDIARRTIQLDIQMMRSDRLGYNAPIEVYERKYYKYAELGFTITESPLSEQDVSRLREVVDMLKQFSGFRQMEEFGGLIGKLRDQLGTGRTDGRRIIDIEYNENLRGLHWIDSLYEIIAKEHRAYITYQSFTAREARPILFEPYFLKEARNRYFVLGRERGSQRTLTLALDRIQEVKDTGDKFELQPGLDIETFFKHTVGVSVSDKDPEEVVLHVSRYRAPYILTKPIHHSQTQTAIGDRYVELTLYVQLSFELESEILSFGSDVQVVKPMHLRRRIRKILEASAASYDKPLDPEEWGILQKRFDKMGFLDLGQLFSLRQNKRLGKAVHQVLKQKDVFPDHSLDASYDITSLLPESRMEIVRKIVAELGAKLNVPAPEHPQLFIRQVPYSASTLKALLTHSKLFIAIHKWREGRTGPHVLPASHRHAASIEVAKALSEVEYSRGFHGDSMHVLLVKEGLLMGVKAQQHGTLLLEVSFG
ncbi:MAG: helix-turn-helix transcriptional regulator [Saprospiraceae bacterium]